MNKPKEYETWLTILEAARLVGRTDRTIFYYVSNEKVTAVKIGKQWLIEPESLRRYFPSVKT